MIRFTDLSLHHAAHRRQELSALSRAAQDARYIRGPRLAAFETSFAAYCGTRSSVGVGSGTDALTIALKAFGIGPGDCVIVPAFTFISTAVSVIAAGAIPVFADVEDSTLTLDPALLERAYTPRIKAVIPVHLYGMPADMDPIGAFARRHGLIVIEDAAQAHGSFYRGRRAGSIGHAGCFSFYPSKNLGGLGDGGAITTSDTKAAERMRILGNIGQKTKYRHVLIGLNSRLDDIQAAVLSTRLPHLDRDNAKRRAISKRYRRLLTGLPIRLPDDPAGRETNMHLFVIRTPKRDTLRAFLTKRGIETGIHYPLPLHREPTLRHLGYRHGAFPVSERAAKTVLSLPMYPEMSVSDQRRIADAVREFFRRVTE